MKKLAILLAGLAVTLLAAAQEQKQNQKAPIVTQYVRCGSLIQPESGKVQRNVLRERA